MESLPAVPVVRSSARAMSATVMEPAAVDDHVSDNPAAHKNDKAFRVPSFVPFALGVSTASIGLLLLVFLAIIGPHPAFSFLSVPGFFITAILWILMALEIGSGKPILSELLKKMNCGLGKWLVYILIVIGSCFVIQWDSKKNIIDPLIFVCFSISWTCVLRLTKVHVDNGIQLALLSGAAVRGVSVYSLRPGASWGFIGYSILVAGMRFFLESKDVDSEDKEEL